MLRMAQNSSVVSNASSTSASASAIDQLHPSSFTDTHLMSGPGFSVPTSRRHHRTSSSASARSVSQAATQGSSSAPIPIPQPHSGSAASALEAARHPRGAPGMSRQNSTTSHRSSSSRNRSPQPFLNSSGFLSSSHSQSHGFPQDYTSGYFPRDRTSSNASMAATPGSELSPGLMPATLRYEETVHYRHELDSAKRENEALKKRVKELERMLRERREGDSGHGHLRGESTSTTSSVTMSGTTGVGGVVGGGTGIAGGRRAIYRAPSSTSVTGSVAVGVPEEELKVGESAATTNVPPAATQAQAQETK